MDLEATLLAMFSALMSVDALAEWGAADPAAIRMIVAHGCSTEAGARLLAAYQARKATMTTIQALDGLTPAWLRAP